MSGRRLLYLDCVGGVAGDMLLGALVEALGDPAPVEAAAASLGFADLALRWSRGCPGGIAARRLDVCFDPAAHPRHRSLADVESLLATAAVSAGARERARAVFRRLAEAEGRVHGESAERVHFHEVGAVDAVVDVLGCCVALEALAVDEVVCSVLPMGHGTVHSEHGPLPLPAPAVVAMLPGVPVRDAGVEGETVTPTGAALVTTLAARFGGMPAMTVESVGMGAGSRSYPGLPNLVRAFVGRPESAGLAATSDNVIVECNLDDLDPRVVPVVLERLLEAGAVDAFVTPIVMKKGRPGHLLTALTPPSSLEGVVGVMLRETTSLGCRTHPVAKRSLERRMETVDTPWGAVQVKVALLGGKALRRIPEFSDCLRLARQAKVPVRDVLAAAGIPPEAQGPSSDEP